MFFFSLQVLVSSSPGVDLLTATWVWMVFVLPPMNVNGWAMECESGWAFPP
jgi:hypothetical protein